jgi:2'-5' RNA ligase
VRLFVGVWPSPEVRDSLAALERPDTPEVRWTPADRWHVTVAFLGHVDGEDLGEWIRLVDTAAKAVGGPPDVQLGPATELLGPSVLSVPAAGLEGVAEVFSASALAAGRVLDPRPYRGHLTLARARRRARLPRSLADRPVHGRWTPTELCLVESVPGARGDPPRYVTLAATAFPTPRGTEGVPMR